MFAVGQVRSGEWPNQVWDLQGVFSTEEKAVAACHGPSFCIMPIELDKELPIESVVPEGSYFPHAPKQ